MEDVIYCRQCKFYRPISETAFECGNIRGLLNPAEDDFCSKAEREESRDLEGQIQLTT